MKTDKLKAAESQACELSVIAPCFNEENNVEELVHRTLRTFDKKKIDGELILVDDCSRDGTWGKISQAMRAEKRVRGIQHPINKGIVEGWRSGLAVARGRFVCLIDSDLQNLPEDIYRLYREIKGSNVDIVQGVRHHIGKLKDSRFILSKGLNIILNTLFLMNAQDNKSGFWVCRKEVLYDILDYKYPFKYFQTFVSVVAHAKEYTIREVETLFVSRETGRSYIPKIPIRFVLEILLEITLAFVEYKIKGVKDNTLSNYVSENQVSKTTEPVHSNRQDRFLRLARILLPFHYWSLSYNCFDYIKELEQSQWLSREQLEELQWIKLQRILAQAYRHVPYYTELFDRIGLKPNMIQGVEDLTRIPVLTKELVRENQFYDLISDNHNKKKVLRVYTGGPDGAPITFYLDQLQLDWRWATGFRSYDWVGYATGNKELRITHGNIGSSIIYRLKEKIANMIRHRKHLSAFELNQMDVSDIVRQIRVFRPWLITSYAETLKILAFAAKKQNIVFDGVQAVFSSSQTLTNKDRELIKARFGAPLFDQYRLREFGIVAIECNHHQGIHVNAENCIVEILDKKGKPVKAGQMGDIVITDLNNRCMPLIRYKTGDRARFIPEVRCGCGRELPRIDSIRGRPQSVIFGQEGHFLPGSFFTHLIKDYEFAIRKFRVVQTERGRLDLYIQPGLRFNPKVKQQLTEIIKRFLGSSTKINITLQEKLEGDVVEGLKKQE